MIKPKNLYVILILCSHYSHADTVTATLSTAQHLDAVRVIEVDPAVDRLSRYQLLALDAPSLVNAAQSPEEDAALEFLGLRIDVDFSSIDMPKYEGVVHLVGNIKGLPNSYARFTVHKDSLFGVQETFVSLVSAAINLGEQTYTIRPVGKSGAHIVYQSNAGLSQPLRLSDDADGERKSRLIDAIGRRYDMLQSVPKDSYSIGIGGVLTRMSDMSEAITQNVRFRSEKDLSKLLPLIGPYLPLIGSESFQFREKPGGGDRREIYDFDQYIDGVLVFGANLRVVADGKTKKVTRISGPVELDRGYSKSPKISALEAQELALKYAKSAFPQREHRFGSADPQRVFLRNPPGSGQPLTVSWAVVLTDGETGKMYFVHGEDGSVRPNTIVDTDEIQICDTDEAGFDEFCHLRSRGEKVARAAECG